MNYDIERQKQESTALQKAFGELFPLAAESDLPSAPCHIKEFLRDRIEREVKEGTYHFVQDVARVLLEVSPPKSHVVDMARIAVEQAKEARNAKKRVEELQDKLREMTPVPKAAQPVVLSDNGFPRRGRIDLNTPAETAIREAVRIVEEAGAHALLTAAVNLLNEARERVADFVELPKAE